MNLALQQTYYFEDGFRFIPQDGFPLRITGKQYYGAVKSLREQGCYIPSEDNPDGKDNFKEREFLMENCFVRLNASSQLHEGRETKVIRIFTGMNDRYPLEKITEELGLSLPQWSLRND